MGAVSTAFDDEAWGGTLSLYVGSDDGYCKSSDCGYREDDVDADKGTALICHSLLSQLDEEEICRRGGALDPCWSYTGWFPSCNLGVFLQRSSSSVV